MHAFLDESVRGGRYLVGVVTSGGGDAAESRKRLRQLCMPGQERLHFASEGDRRRRALLTEFGRLNFSATVFVVRQANEVLAREQALAAVVSAVIAQDVDLLRIESRSVRDRDDGATLRRLIDRGSRLGFDHTTPRVEPMLWLPDGITWAVGRSPEWRRRVEASGIDIRVVNVSG